MSYVYFVWYGYEYEDINDIDVIAEGKLVDYVRKMIDDERIYDESITEFREKTGKDFPENDKEAIDLLKIDVWDVKKQYVLGSED